MTRRSPMHLLLKNLMLAVQSINFACMDFWSPYLVQIGAAIRCPLLTSTRIRYSARIGL